MDKFLLVPIYITMKLMQTLLYGRFGLFLITEVCPPTFGSLVNTHETKRFSSFSIFFFFFSTLQSETLRDSIYFCGWPGCSNKLFLSNINAMLLCRHLALKACQFYEISIDMFMTVSSCYKMIYNIFFAQRHAIINANVIVINFR